MNHVERFRHVMSFESVDRLPKIEWAMWWDKTLERWYGEGLPRQLQDVTEIAEYLGLDSYRQFWISPLAPDCPEPESHGAGLVKDAEEYDKFKKYLYPVPPFDSDLVKKWVDAHDRGELVVWITLEGFFWTPREILGIEPHIYAFYDQPELMHQINEDVLAFNIRALQEFREIITPEYMTFAEDMSYNHGPMLSKVAFDEFVAPYYKRIVPLLKERGIVPFVDSDGDITTLIPWLEEVGIEGLVPLEKMAGVDVAQIRKDHPRFKLIGAFDKVVLNKGERAIRNEFERLLPVMNQGGFIPSVDHQTPPEVSLEQYRGYVNVLKEYCEKVRE